jgi:catechol 2,3-dioxygenase-like lactoylglutathione lyase family enzyme
VRLTHVRLLVDDFASMLAFYRDTLGLRIGFNDGENFAEVDAGADVQISLFVRHGMNDAIEGGARPSGGDGAVVIFSVDGVDTTYERLRSRGVVFVTSPRDMQDWGIRVAHFRDPEGNLLEINEPLARD